MSAVSIAPANQNITKNITEISKSDVSGKNITQGEIIPAKVIESLTGNRYLVALKNLQIIATSTVPLNTGEKLILRVNSLQPQMILNIVEGQKPESADLVNEKLLQWRSNPDSFLDVIGKLAEFTKNIQDQDLPLNFSSKNVIQLLSLFDEIIFSNGTKENPLFLKEFVSKTGLLLENTLQQLVHETLNGKIEQPFNDNIKSLLLKLFSTVEQALIENSKLDHEITSKLMNLSSFTEEAIKSIETRQVLNAVFQDSDNGLVLQIPLALAEGMRPADIFIMPEDKKGKGKNKFSSGNVVIFLNLDILGKIAANIRVSEGNFRCIIKCDREEVKDLINNELAILKKKLSGIGYKVDYIDCIMGTELEQQREEFLQKQAFSGTELVNFFA
jgi:hypothetical protein